MQEKKEMGQRNVIEEDIKFVAGLSLPWGKSEEGKTVLLSGASGMIGSLLVSVLMERPESIRSLAHRTGYRKASTVWRVLGTGRIFFSWPEI